MGRKLVIVLLAGLLFSILLATPRASAGSDTEYLSYTVEENKTPPTVTEGSVAGNQTGGGVGGAGAGGGVSSLPSPSPSYTPPSYTPARNPDFSISISPKSRTITRGESTTYTVTVVSVDGFSGYVSLGVSGLPSGAGYSLPSRVGVPANGSAVASLTVTTTTSTAAGDSTVTVTGTGSGTKSASAGLTITAPAPPAPTPVIPPLPTIGSYNFDDRRSDIPLNTPLGQQVQANWGNPTAIGAAVAAQRKSDLVSSVTKVQQGLNTIVAKVSSVIQQLVNAVRNWLSGLFR